MGIGLDEQGSVKIEGDSDGTLIGNVGDALKVNQAFAASDVSGCPTVSNKLRIEFSETDVTIGATLVTLFSYTGSGKLFGFIFKNDHKEVQTKLTIDSTEVIFDLKSEDIGDVQLSNPDIPDLVQEMGGIMTADNDKSLAFKLSCPIEFATSVKIEAKRTGSTDHTMLRSMVALTKET